VSVVSIGLMHEVEDEGAEAVQRSRDSEVKPRADECPERAELVP
jgi:hypothetical protein